MTSPLVIVTGATDGIGLETAGALAERGARVILHGRDAGKLTRAVQLTSARGTVAGEVRADLASLAEVRAMAAEVAQRFGRPDVLLNNAGVFMKRRVLTVDGFETTFAVNHLAHVLLTHLLLPQGRVVNVSSGAHMGGRLDWDDLQGEQGFDGHAAYATSKLANVLITVELGRRLRGRGVNVNCLHPGVVTTNLLRTGFGGGGPDSTAEGAATSVYLALEKEGGETTGQYFVRQRVATPHRLAQDEATCARFYELSCEMVGVAPIRGLTAALRRRSKSVGALSPAGGERGNS